MIKHFTEERCKGVMCGLFFQPVARFWWRVNGYCSYQCTPEYQEAQRKKAQKKEAVAHG